MNKSAPHCQIICGDCRAVLGDFTQHIDLIVTSPPMPMRATNIMIVFIPANLQNGFCRFTNRFGTRSRQSAAW